VLDIGFSAALLLLLVGPIVLDIGFSAALLLLLVGPIVLDIGFSAALSLMCNFTTIEVVKLDTERVEKT
jgi:hypothetical protein